MLGRISNELRGLTMSIETEVTGTHCQHADDIGRDISNTILDWERRNPGAKVIEIKFTFNRDVMAPYGYIQTKIERDDGTKE